MNKQYFAICDEDSLYAGKLYEYIHERESDTYEVILFTKPEALEDFMKEERLGILLISAVSRALVKGSMNAENILILTQMLVPGSHRADEIYKYQSGDRIIKAVMEYLSSNATSAVKRSCGKPLNVYGVYSPVKRSFQTTFSIALGQILSKKEKTLYINFECFSGFDYLMSRSPSADLMDLVYFKEVGGESFAYRLESMVEKVGNLDYIPPVRSFRSFEEITGEEWVGFIKGFGDFTDYENIILDLSESVNGLFDILRLCKTVYTVTDERRISKAKMSHYEAILAEDDYGDVIDKTRKLKIPVFREVPDEFEMLPYSELTTFIKKELDFEDSIRKEVV